MKLYAGKKTDSQYLQKSCLDIDRNINALVHYIDNFCPNYRILNLPNSNNFTYIPNNMLGPTGANIVFNREGHTWVNPDNMHPHNVLDNTFQEDIGIGNTTSPSWANAKKVPEGYALRHDGYDSNGNVKYSIISLASSGTYYVIDSFIITNISNSTVTTNIQWRLQDNATDIYGKNFLFSLTVPGSRFYYHHENGGDTIQSLGNSPFIIANFANTPATPVIATSKNGIWNTGHILMHEIELINNGNVEDVFGDDVTLVDEVRIGEYVQSRYTINTDIKNIDNNIYVNLY